MRVQSTEQKAQMTQALAKVLGTTPDAITAQLNAGKTPQDIIKASGLDAATVKAQLDVSREADMKTRLATDVTSGKLTQAQADQMITDMAAHKGNGRHHGMNIKASATVSPAAN